MTRISVGLVIEDDEDVRALVGLVLSDAGLDVYNAANGTAAIRLALELQPSLITLDLGLPDADGLEILTKLRETSFVPIIVLSARSITDLRTTASGADGYLRKPFRLHELRSLVNALLP